ncbi:hypothetical protein ACX40Y_08300 [Sphingomonas sp. RS6]
MRWIDWIWHVRGSVPAPAAADAEEAFGRLASLFQERGTTLDRDGNRLRFHKDNPDSQDRFASFTNGQLEFVAGDEPSLRFDLVSHALLWCFVAPLPFALLALLVESLRIPAYSFAGIFAALYVAGRWIEQRQARHALRSRLDVLQAAPMDEAIPA